MAKESAFLPVSVAEVRERGWDAVVISGSDPHSSEYPAPRWKQVEWISGFTGEAGDIVVTADHAGLWTDTRYFIQAVRQLDGTGIVLHKTRVPDQVLIPEWLASRAFAGKERCVTVAVDGLCQGVSAVAGLKEENETAFAAMLAEVKAGMTGEEIAAIVEATNSEDEAEEKFGEINGRLEKYSLRATFYSSLTNPVTRFVNSLVYAAVGVFGAISAINGGITVGALSCFLSYANQYTKPFNEISGVVTELQNALACAGRLFELIEREPQTPEPENAVELKDAQGSIKAENVSFSYVPDKKLIEGLQLDIKPGQKVAIVGPTGCGKTTIVNLLMHFYDATSGGVTMAATTKIRMMA